MPTTLSFSSLIKLALTFVFTGILFVANGQILVSGSMPLDLAIDARSAALGGKVVADLKPDGRTVQCAKCGNQWYQDPTLNENDQIEEIIVTSAPSTILQNKKEDLLIADKHLKKAIKHDPKFLFAHTQKAFIATKLGDYERAEELLNFALEIAKHDGSSISNGYVYSILGPLYILWSKLKPTFSFFRLSKYFFPNKSLFIFPKK